MWQKPPHQDREGDHSYTAHCRADCIESNGESCSPSSLETRPLFALRLMFFDQRSTGGEYGRESKKQATDNGTKAICNETSRDGDTAANDEPNCIFMPLSLENRAQIDFDLHRV